MPTLNMQGPYPLTIDKINEVVTRKSPGNYALGHSDEKTFYVKYVGRADSDLNDRLKKWVGSYPEFKFSYASSPKAAFEKESHNYHDFGGADKLDNDIHPDRPDGTDWACPVCDIYDE
jgi:hypothetical protein